MTSSSANPFIYEDALGPDVSDLVGRGEIIAELSEHMRRHATLVLTGTRYIGKTSILNFLTAEMQRQKWQIVRVECLGCATYEDLCKRVINGMSKLDDKKARQVKLRVAAEVDAIETTEEWGADVKLLHKKSKTSRTRTGVGSGKERLEITFSAIRDVCGKKLSHLAFFFDESHYLAFDEDVLAVLKAHLKDQGISTVFTGSKRRMLTQMFAHDQSAYARRATIVEVRNIDPNVFQQFIVRKFEESSKGITPEAVRLLFGYVGISPQRVQEMAHYTWELTETGEVAGVDRVDEALHAAIRRNRPYFVSEFKEMGSEPERELKRALARTPLPSLGSNKWFDEVGLARVGAFRRKLEELEQEDEILLTTSGEYRLRDPLFTLWMNESEMA